MRSQKRAGFTLIELMVAMTLTLVIMAILSQAFVLALETFSGLKGIGDMQQNIRTAAVQLHSDLGSEHLDGRRLSDASLLLVNNKIQSGFFIVRQGSAVSVTAPAPYLLEGNDQNNVPSFRAVDQFLYFTVKRKGNRQEDSFSTALDQTNPAFSKFFSLQTAYNISSQALEVRTLSTPYYASQWAEVMYYLERTGSTEEPNVPISTLGTPTYALKRAQFVMVSDSTNLNNAAAATRVNYTDFATLPAYSNLACRPVGTNATDVVNFFSPIDAAMPTGLHTIDPTTFAAPQPPLNAPPTTVLEQQLTASSTLVLPNVISFQVQVMPTAGNQFVDVGYYDTTQLNTAGYTNNFGLRAIQITMRVWDFKTRQTRQTTIMRDL